MEGRGLTPVGILPQQPPPSSKWIRSRWKGFHLLVCSKVSHLALGMNKIFVKYGGAKQRQEVMSSVNAVGWWAGVRV